MLAVAHRAATGRATLFTAPDDDWYPVVFLRTASELHLVGVPLIQGRKDEAAEAITELMRRRRAVAAAMLVSSWMTVVDGPLVQSPVRREVLIFHAVDPVDELFRYATVRRHPHRPPALDPMGDVPAQRIGGIFPEALRRGLR